MTHVDLKKILEWPPRVESKLNDYACDLMGRLRAQSKRCNSLGLAEMVDYFQISQYGPILAKKKRRYSREQVAFELKSICNVLEYYTDLHSMPPEGRGARDRCALTI